MLFTEAKRKRQDPARLEKQMRGTRAFWAAAAKKKKESDEENNAN